MRPNVIKYREQNGPFKTIEDIKKVSGIGDATFLKIRDYITVGDAGQSSIGFSGGQRPRV